MVKKNRSSTKGAKPLTEENLRKDFYKFQGKVEHLEKIRHELNTLNTKGFEKEVSVMRSRLKDTNAIPALESLLPADLENLSENSIRYSFGSFDASVFHKVNFVSYAST